MSPAQPASPLQGVRDLLYRIWTWVLDLCLVIWVARASVALLGLGFLILGKAPQAQDLLIPLVGSPYYRFGGFFPVVFALWAMPTHYAARLAIDDDARLDRLLAQRRDESHSAWLEFVMCQGPRLLGALTFVAFAICACRARINYPVTPGEDASLRNAIFAELNWFMVWCAVAFALFFLYAVKRQDGISRLRVVGYAERLAAVAAPIIDGIDIGRSRSMAPMRAGYLDSYLGRTMLFVYFWAFVAVMLFNPFFIADWLPRGWVVALILGGWLPVLAYLSVLGRRLRAPLIIGVFGGLAILVAIIGDNHAVRILSAERSRGGSRTSLNDALDAWMKANGCDAATVARCPRPFIVVAAGGASRAGFFTASVIGRLLDQGSADGHGLDAAHVRDRLFAISGISGGSVGAVMAVSALARGQAAATQPCRTDTPVPLWYGGNVTSWRGCLEALMAGDFLTPGFIGLSFHDMVPLPFIPDRASLLERSWERYARAVLKDVEASDSCPADLDCPFLNLRSKTPFWLPLLILNGTSLSNGQRIVTTNLAPTYRVAHDADCPLDAEHGNCRLFAETYAFHDLVNAAPQGGNPDRNAAAITYDVRLSTAASNSARFPFVSPPGEIFRQEPRKLIDRIADGGYLENFGVLSAIDLVDAIRVLQPALKPFVLVISNDPNLAVDPQAEPTNVHSTDFLTDITGFISGFATTRDARASIGLVHLRTLVERENPGCRASLEHIRIWPTSAEGENTSVISMSWWLSKPVQRRLAFEVGPDSRNKTAFAAVWTALSRPDGGCAVP